VLLWFIPFYTPEMKGKGLFFPRIPEVKSKDIGILQKDG
jgi:hypothetical protein